MRLRVVKGDIMGSRIHRQALCQSVKFPLVSGTGKGNFLTSAHIRGAACVLPVCGYAIGDQLRVEGRCAIVLWRSRGVFNNTARCEYININKKQCFTFQV